MGLTAAQAASEGAPGRWMGRKVVGANVVYIAAEGQRGMRNRGAAWFKEHPEASPEDMRAHFQLVPAALDLRSTEDDARALIAASKRHFGERGVDLVIVDTLARSFGGGDENSGQDMGQFVKVVGLIQRELSAAAMVVHHCGKDESKGLRGHSSLLAALDVELEIRRLTAGRLLSTGKVKDGRDDVEIGFDLKAVVLGVQEPDYPGEPQQLITSCVPYAVDGEAVKKSGKAVALRGAPKAVWEALVDRGGMDGWVRWSEVFARALKRPEVTNDRQDPDKSEKALLRGRKDKVKKALAALVEKGRIDRREDEEGNTFIKSESAPDDRKSENREGLPEW